MSEIEKIPETKFSPEYKLKILEELAKVESFNSFLNDKLKTSKRFGVEGLDSMISGLSKYLSKKRSSRLISFNKRYRVYWFRYGSQRSSQCFGQRFP